MQNQNYDPNYEPTDLEILFIDILDGFSYDKDPSGKLIVTAALGKAKEAILTLIEQGVDLECLDEEGRTILMCAALRGDKEIVETLIRAGASPADLDEKNETVLMYAVENSNPDDLVEFFLNLKDKNSDINQCNDSGVTALMFAVEYGTIKTVNLLLAARANPNAQDEDGFTALIRTTDNTSSDALLIIQALIKAGANVNHTSHIGTTALSHAASDGTLAIVQALLDGGANPHSKEKKTAMTPFLWSVSNTGPDGEKIMQLLLSKGANINQTNESGTTALMGAAKCGTASMARALLKAGSDVNATEKIGSTALFYAILNDEPEGANLVKVLIDAGAHVNIVNHYGITPLLAAIALKTKEVVQLLLDAGANPDTADFHKTPPLIHALKNEPYAFEMVNLLLEFGVSVNAVIPNLRITALDCTTDPIIRRLLEKHGAMSYHDENFLKKNPQIEQPLVPTSKKSKIQKRA